MVSVSASPPAGSPGAHNLTGNRPGPAGATQLRPARTASGRGAAPQPQVRSGRSGPGGLEDEHRDLAGGLLLIFGVGRVGGDGPLPPLGPLVPRDLPGDHVPPAG